MYADLHLHSTFSDGTDTPLELFKIAEKSHIKVIAISDHDSVEGVKSIINSDFTIDIKFIPAIEVSTIYNRKLMHLLGYYVDVFNSDLNSLIIFHPTHSKEEVEKYQQIAKDKKLYITGGSDWHGGNNDPSITHMGITGLSHDGYDILNL